MDSFSAFYRGEAAREANAPQKCFDWKKAARLIRERGATDAYAGLRGDWDYTGGRILEDGNPDMESYTYLSSCWATPELDIDGDVVDCYFVVEQKDCDYDPGAKWPEEALAILRGEGV